MIQISFSILSRRACQINSEMITAINSGLHIVANIHCYAIFHTAAVGIGQCLLLKPLCTQRFLLCFVLLFSLLESFQFLFYVDIGSILLLHGSKKDFNLFLCIGYSLF